MARGSVRYSDVYSAATERAVRAALAAHDGQTRKGSDTPYVSHPIHVALLLARAGADETTIQAGVLHDVVEDCDDWTCERVSAEFGQGVAAIVDELTEDKGKTWEERKRYAADHVPDMRIEAVLVKAADKLHNLSSLLHDLQAAEAPEDVWEHFNRGPEQTLALARELVLNLRVRLSDLPSAGPLSEALLGTLEQVERLSLTR